MVARPRDELEELLGYRQPDGRNISGGQEPWKTCWFNDPTKRLVTKRVAQSDFEVLLQMADLDTIQFDVRRFALQKLKDFGADLQVLEAYRRQLTEVEHSTRENTLFHTRLYYTIQGLGSCGQEALPELDRAEGILRTTRIWNHPKSRLAEPYRLALRESRRVIAAHPIGISRSGTESGGD